MEIFIFYDLFLKIYIFTSHLWFVNLIIDFVVPDNTTNKPRQVLQTFNYNSETKKNCYQRLLMFYKFFDVVSHLLVKIDECLKLSEIDINNHWQKIIA
jgi:hypothetical protein